MARLGKNQIELLARMTGQGRAVVVGDKLIRSLAKAGCMSALSHNGDSFYVVTSAGLRAVADALDAGSLPPVTIDDFKKAVR
jgi:hypothetical protein